MNRDQNRLLIALLFFSLTVAGATELISVSSTGTQGDNNSTYPAISADGHFVAFSSLATDLVAGDTNGMQDIFVRDRINNTTERVSVGSAGEQGDGHSSTPSISADGRFVAFASMASNLVAGDSNGVQDIFVRDLINGTTKRVSVDSVGGQGNNLSLIPLISADGYFVVFASTASNLVAGDNNGVQDIFVHDLTNGTTERISVSSAGIEADDVSTFPSISANGRFIAFSSPASNLVAGANNGFQDIFVHDRTNGTTEQVSVNSAGMPADSVSIIPSISGDGRLVVFSSYASNLAAGDSNGVQDIFVRDLINGTTERVSVSSTGAQGNSDSEFPAISADGRFIVFQTASNSLVAGDNNGVSDIFVHNRQTGVTERVSVSSVGAQSNDESNTPAISADGQYIVFSSIATNLVGSDDTNGFRDIFIYDRLRAAGVNRIPTMRVEFLIVLIGLVGSMALLMRVRTNRRFVR